VDKNGIGAPGTGRVHLSLLKTSSAFELLDLRLIAAICVADVRPYINVAEFPSRRFRSRASMQAEIIGLRHQLTVLQRNQKPNGSSSNASIEPSRVWLSRIWSRWRSALFIVKPETVIRWHRQGFRCYWTSKIRHGRSGRPCVLKETRNLI
jgi:hypothetical protein